MCSLAAASFAISAVSSGSSFIGQRRSARANERLITESTERSFAAVRARQQENRLTAAQNISDVQRSARESSSIALLSALESGVSGASLRALLRDIRAQGARGAQRQRQTLQASERQSERTIQGLQDQAASRLAQSAVAPSLLSGLLGIAGSAVSSQVLSNDLYGADSGFLGLGGGEGGDGS